VAVVALIYTAQTVAATNEQVGLTREGQFTERYSKALEQLGSSTADVRIGAIFSLERTLTDSTRDRAAIVNLLSTFVRNRAPRQSLVHPFEAEGEPSTCDQPRTPAEEISSDTKPSGKRPAADVQAAMTVLSRLPRDHEFPGRVNLRSVDLAGLELPGADFSGMDLSGTDLSNAMLVGANLSGARFGQARLAGALLSRARLAHSYFGDAVLDAANFVGANLTGADFSSATFIGANFTYMTDIEWFYLDLVGVTFDRDHLPKPVFNGAKFTAADISGAILWTADLSATASMEQVAAIGTSLSSANLSHVDLSGAILCDASLSMSDLHGAKLSETDLTRAELSAAIVYGTTFTNTKFVNSSFGGADLTKCIFTGADVTGARFQVDPSELAATLEEASYNAGVMAPDGSSIAIAINDLPRTNLTGVDFSRARGLTKPQVARFLADRTISFPTGIR
jgi:uncharacterized protein YjbI with pentapeptide repeats